MDSLKTKLFGTSGVRGETNKEISPNLALELSIAFGEWFNKYTIWIICFLKSC
jgi:phosphomannomutase